MLKFIVIDADPARDVFVAEDIEGNCGVYWVLSGRCVEAGDILQGSPVAKGHCRFTHADGICVTNCETGAIKRTEAIARLRIKY